MASSLVTREILLEEIRQKFPNVSTNTNSEEFLAAARSCLGELLEPEIQVDNLVGSQKSKFDDHIWNFASKVSTWMRLKKNKVNMIKWKRRWFDEIISLGEPDSKEPDSKKSESKIPAILTYENASKSTKKRRKRFLANEKSLSELSGTLALSYHDQGQSQSAQVIRELEKDPNLGAQLLKTISDLKNGKTNESVLPKLAVPTIRYAANVLGLYIFRCGRVVTDFLPYPKFRKNLLS